MYLTGQKEILEQLRIHRFGGKNGKEESGYELRVRKMSSFNGINIEKRHNRRH